MSILIITEHSRVAKFALSKLDTNAHALILPPLKALRFDYPSHLNWNDYPKTQAAAYKQLKLKDLELYALSDAHLTQSTSISSELKSVTHVIYMMCPDHRAAMAFKVFKDQCLHSDVTTDYVFLSDLSEQTMNSAWSKKGPSSEFYTRNLDYARTKYFFDYNWNLNAMAIFGKTMAVSGVKTSTQLSKYSLQLYLHLLKTTAGRWTESQLVTLLQHWTGTGKYDYSGISMGSPNSVLEIINNLKSLKLLESEHDKLYKLSDYAMHLNKFIHKDCNDQDLPYRLYEWSKLSVSDAQDKMTKYINTFFGKQKRYLNR